MKIVTGEIKAQDNFCSDEYDLFYRATFVPLIHKNDAYTIVIETGFDIHYERKTLICTLNGNDVTFDDDDYRMTICPASEYEIYKNKISYKKKEETSEATTMPWIRFPRTKDGVSIPLLLDRILEGNFDRIYFNK